MNKAEELEVLKLGLIRRLYLFVMIEVMPPPWQLEDGGPEGEGWELVSFGQKCFLAWAFKKGWTP